jgi:hypothetical protein
MRILIPYGVKREAMKAFKLRDSGYVGATEAGWNRAWQLANKKDVSIEDFRVIRNWFARHYYTSRPGYLEWVKSGGNDKTKREAGKVKREAGKAKERAVISWLTWGGESGLKWVNNLENIKKLNKVFNPTGARHNTNYDLIG